VARVRINGDCHRLASWPRAEVVLVATEFDPAIGLHLPEPPATAKIPRHPIDIQQRILPFRSIRSPGMHRAGKRIERRAVAKSPRRYLLVQSRTAIIQPTPEGGFVAPGLFI